MDELEGKQIREIVTRLLSRREHSYFELLQKLQLRGFKSDDVRQMVDRFTLADIQSDQRFAESFARQSISKGQGEQRIRAGLKERQVCDEYVQQALNELQPDWFELARAVFIKKYGHHVEMDWQQQQKCYRYLQYRGFNQEQIRYACEGENE